MALKEKYDTNDQDTAKIDIPLFATVDDAVKDIKLEDSVIKINVVKENKKEEK